jgi:hypothetical protein
VAPNVAREHQEIVMSAGTGPSISGEDGGSEEAGMWTQPRFVWAAAVLLLIAVFAVVLVVTGPDEPPATSTAPGTPGRAEASTPGASPATGGETSVCALPPGKQTVPVSTPQTTWVLVGTVASPQAPDTIGPGRIDDGVRSCYAHSPLGALYAAANFLASTSDPALRLKAVQELTAAGGGHDRAIELMKGESAGTRDSGLQIAGFAFLGYAPSSATVDVAMRVEAQNIHLPMQLRWDRDWKIVLPPDGRLFDTIQPLPDLTGYVPWSGA